MVLHAEFPQPLLTGSFGSARGAEAAALAEAASYALWQYHSLFPKVVHSKRLYFPGLNAFLRLFRAIRKRWVLSTEQTPKARLDETQKGAETAWSPPKLST